jgi:Eco29kI restriction endonuclease
MAATGRFDIDIKRALTSQLLDSFGALAPAPLEDDEVQTVEGEPGVYQLFNEETLVYVGKTDGSMRKRLSEHVEKISGRNNISLDEMTFSALYVSPNWTALAPETTLIAHYRREGLCAWNGNGFGPHDPGRSREETNKPPDGFDAQYPIKGDWSCDWIEAGSHNCSALLRSLKSGLPYLLRYQTTGSLAAGHPDYNEVTVDVPQTGMPATELLALISSHLPGWQATAFPSHLILYNQSRDYAYGRVLERS